LSSMSGVGDKWFRRIAPGPRLEWFGIRRIYPKRGALYLGCPSPKSKMRLK
jgi:hypothetical protein